MESVLKLHEVSSRVGVPHEQKRFTNTSGVGKIPREDFEKKLIQMMNTIEMLESKLTQKADEVVSYQLLTQRQEMNELSELLTKIEKRLEKVEKKIEEVKYEEEEFVPIHMKRKDRRPKKLSFQV